ncbi:MAG: hypothetical protein H6814_06350 [Phycisphaeraceae bacterium]|nr:hypothetical protein [Phycisphaeraceae bacterium]
MQKLLAGDGETPDQFGTSVDTYGSRMIIGAKYGNFDFIIDCGAAYIWKEAVPGSWEQEAKLNAPDAETDDVFGFATALGDGVALVGAYFADIGPSIDNDRSGAVYSFTRAMDGTWGFHQLFHPNAPVAGELFGAAMALDGGTLLVGAPAFGGSGLAGQAQVWERDMSGTWQHAQTLVATDSMVGDSFGWSLDLEGDTAVVGAWGNDSAQGAVYVFTRDAMTGLWDSGVRVVPDVRIANERFGWSVSISGDAILVGATQETTTATGAAYVFRGDGVGGWTQEDRLVGAEAGPRAQVGRSVKLSGDHALVGASEAGVFPVAGDNGSVYVFRRTGGLWAQTERIRAGDGEPDDQFGGAIALHEDLLLVAAKTEDEFGFNAGAAYVFDTHDAFCPADLNGDLVVDTADLGLLLSGFGGTDPALDINGDGVVDTADLGLLLAAFGGGCD